MNINYSPVYHIDGRADIEEIRAAIKASMEKENARLEKLWVNGNPIPEPVKARVVPVGDTSIFALAFWNRLLKNLHNAWELTRQGY